MKKLRMLMAAAGVLSVLCFAACKSTPQENPVPQNEPVAEDPVQIEEPGPDVENEPGEEQDPEPSSGAADANRALLEKVEVSRKAARESGADSANPGAYKATELEYAALKTAVSAGSDEDLSGALNDLNERYLALSAYANAKAKKDRIDDLDFASYDQSSYDAGSRILDELSNPLSNIAAGADWNKKAISAEGNFDKVLDAAFRSLARTERINAFNAKKNADSVKAAVSRKDEYNKGVEFFTRGDSNYSTKNPEGALSNYTGAKETFERLYAEILEARSKAQGAVEAAKARVSQSEEVAEEADQRSPLGDGEFEGIEDEDTMLLEEDDFSDAESAAQELENSVDATVDEEAEK